MFTILIAGILAAGLVQGPAPTPGSETSRLRAEAGLGGFARAGRWTPVRVEVDNADHDLDGEIVVEWGDARVHRAVNIPAPSRTAIELYVRTGDVRGSMTVRLVSNGAPLSSVEIPIRILADEERLVVCAGAEPSAAENGLPCTATVTPEALPRSLRGYVAADDVRLQPGAEARLTVAQRTALQRWRAYRELDAEGLLTQAPRAPLAGEVATGVDRPTLVAAGTAVAALLWAAWIWTRSRGAPLRAYAALAGAVMLGVVAATVAGRFGPGAEIRLRHATTVQQVGDGSLVAMRATLGYPASGAYAIRALRLDGELMPRAGAAEQWLDADGAPIRRGVFGRGARDQIDVDGVADYAPFQVTVENDIVRVHNRSDLPLTDCEFPEGFSETHAGQLAPGSSVSARTVGAVAAPFFSCVMPEPPVAFSEARFPVRVEGTAIVSVKLPGQSRISAIE